MVLKKRKSKFEETIKPIPTQEVFNTAPKPIEPLPTSTREGLPETPTQRTFPQVKQPDTIKSIGRPAGQVSLADRQELADLRARQSGIETRLLDPVRESGILSERKFQEAPLVAGEAEAEQIAVAQEAIRVEQPERRELDPSRTALGAAPVIGPLAEGILKAVGFTPSVNLDATPEEMKTLALTKIEKQEINKGITASENFGQFVEAIPVFGSLASKYAGGLLETPSENTQTILKELKTEKTRATNAEIKVKDGTLSQAAGQEIIDGVEQNIQRMESRIKLLVQNSPELKFNSDGVNFIETKILESRERLFQAKINMAAGAAKDPTEIDLLRSLQGSISAEDFTIPNR